MKKTPWLAGLLFLFVILWLWEKATSEPKKGF